MSVIDPDGGLSVAFIPRNDGGGCGLVIHNGTCQHQLDVVGKSRGEQRRLVPATTLFGEDCAMYVSVNVSTRIRRHRLAYWLGMIAAFLCYNPCFGMDVFLTIARIEFRIDNGRWQPLAYTWVCEGGGDDDYGRLVNGFRAYYA